MNDSWLGIQALVVIHEGQLVAHGGKPGIQRRSAFETIVNVPNELYPDVELTAAAYAITILRERPFVAANKRMALMALGMFLELHARQLDVYPYDCVLKIEQLANDNIAERAFVTWVRENTVAR